MTYEKILAKLAPKNRDGLLAQVQGRGLTSKQAARIILLLSSAPAGRYTGEYALNAATTQLLYILDIMHRLRFNSELHAKTVKLLMNPDNIKETAAEVMAHDMLQLIFKEYMPSIPLFEQGQDGDVLLNEVKIPLEIKTRTPVKYDLLLLFFEKVEAVLKPRTGIIYKYDILIKNIGGLTKGAVKQALSEIEKRIEQTPVDLRLINPSGLPVGQAYFTKLNYNFNDFHFELTIKADRSSLYSMINLMPAQVANAFTFSVQQVFIEDGIQPASTCIMHLADSVKSVLANAFILQTFKNNSNIPEEPRIVVIYSGEALDQGGFAEQVIERYLKSHPGTIFLILEVSFTGREWIRQYHLHYAGIGVDLQDFMERAVVYSNITAAALSDAKARLIQKAP